MSVSDESTGTPYSKFKISSLRNPLRYKIKNGKWVRVSPKRKAIFNPNWYTPEELLNHTGNERI